MNKYESNPKSLKNESRNIECEVKLIVWSDRSLQLFFLNVHQDFSFSSSFSF